MTACFFVVLHLTHHILHVPANLVWQTVPAGFVIDWLPGVLLNFIP